MRQAFVLASAQELVCVLCDYNFTNKRWTAGAVNLDYTEAAPPKLPAFLPNPLSMPATISDTCKCKSVWVGQLGVPTPGWKIHRYLVMEPEESEVCGGEGPQWIIWPHSPRSKFSPGFSSAVIPEDLQVLSGNWQT